MNIDVHMAFQRAKVNTVSARAEAALARLGGDGHHEIRPRNHEAGNEDPPLRSSSTAGLSAEELERDTASIKKILGVWRAIGKRDASPVRLASGRWIIPKKSAERLSSPRENALGRPRRRRGWQS
jgi:hypothetical protein